MIRVGTGLNHNWQKAFPADIRKWLFHKIKGNRMTSFMDFTRCQKMTEDKVWNFSFFLKHILSLLPFIKTRNTFYTICLTCTQDTVQNHPWIHQKINYAFLYIHIHPIYYHCHWSWVKLDISWKDLARCIGNLGLLRFPCLFSLKKTPSYNVMPQSLIVLIVLVDDIHRWPAPIVHFWNRRYSQGFVESMSLCDQVCAHI